MASPSGDRGRDAQLIAPDNDPTVVLQYSVSEDWKAKIRRTAKQVSKNLPSARLLIYLTNRAIGAQADSVTQEIRRDPGIMVDWRDRSWFLDRCELDDARRAATERFVKAVADPILRDNGLLERRASPLTSVESRAAVVYLGLQWEDDTQAKGLTRVAFEALVCSVLRRTNPDNRLSRAAIRSGVRGLLPSHPEKRIDELTDQALSKLTKRRVRHYQAEDEFCLTYEERQRLTDRLASNELRDAAFLEEVRRAAKRLVDAEAPDGGIELQALATAARRVIERFLLGRGELFVAAVSSGEYEYRSSQEELRRAVVSEMAQQPLKCKKGVDIVSLLTAVAMSVLETPGQGTTTYLQSLAHSYTLFAFLRETPDVQAAVVKMFSHGELWLDASVVLPLLAEGLLEDDDGRRFTSIVKAANEAELSLRVTEGVIEEVERHINKSLAYAQRSGRWEGNVPFLYSAFVLSGRSPNTFTGWLELFRGQQTPRDDVKAYLKEEFHIESVSLVGDARRAPQDLRGLVESLWLEAKTRKLRRDDNQDVARRLAEHDAESFLGVIEKRRGEDVSPFGYSAWWVTLDGAALQIQKAVSGRFRAEGALVRPVMSPDFLSNYLTLGPVRQRISRDIGRSLPVLVGVEDPLHVETPPEILGLAAEIRERFSDLPERLIQRKVRDALLEAKQRRGAIARAGAAGAEESLRKQLAQQGPQQPGKRHRRNRRRPVARV